MSVCNHNNSYLLKAYNILLWKNNNENEIFIRFCRSVCVCLLHACDLRKSYPFRKDFTISLMLQEVIYDPFFRTTFFIEFFFGTYLPRGRGSLSRGLLLVWTLYYNSGQLEALKITIIIFRTLTSKLILANVDRQGDWQNYLLCSYAR